MDTAELRRLHAAATEALDEVAMDSLERLEAPETGGQIDVAIGTVRAAVNALPVLLDRLDTCPMCGHEWRRHDPEDGRCDAHSKEGLGVCECGRDKKWMRGKIASLSRAALDTEQPCEHEWVDARNEAVISGELCVKCNAIRAGEQP